MAGGEKRLEVNHPHGGKLSYRGKPEA